MHYHYKQPTLHIGHDLKTFNICSVVIIVWVMNKCLKRLSIFKIIRWYSPIYCFNLIYWLFNFPVNNSCENFISFSFPVIRIYLWLEKKPKTFLELKIIISANDIFLFLWRSIVVFFLKKKANLYYILTLIKFRNQFQRVVNKFTQCYDITHMRQYVNVIH